MFPDELVIIGVHSGKFSTEQQTESIRQAVMRHGIQHPVVNDADFKIWNSYAVRAWPTLVLIDPRGRIAGEISGEILAEEFAQHIRAVIEQHPQEIDRAPLEQRPDARIQPDRPLRFPSRLLKSGSVLFIADTGHHRILEFHLDEDGLGGTLARVIGSGLSGLVDGTAAEAAFSYPHGLGLRGSPESGTLFVADTENHAVRAVDLSDGSVHTLAGTGEKAHGRLTLGSPETVPLRSPWAVLPLEQYLLIAMAGSHQIWLLTGEGQLGPFAGNGYEALVDGPVAESSFNQPSDLAFGMGHVFVADPEASAVRAISLLDSPSTITLVGQGLFDFGDQDGSGQSALLQHPVGLDFSGGLVYIADTYNNKIKLLDPAEGTVQTLIGDGVEVWRDGSFEQARLFEPEGVIESQGFLYIADTNNHQVRVADLAERQLHTFRMRGLERIPTVEQYRPVERLNPLEVSPGVVTLHLDVRLPAGYKRSTDAPAVIQWSDGEDQKQLYFAAGEPIQWQVQTGADKELPVDVILYYCQEKEALLCMIHNRRLIIPLVVRSGGQSKVRVPFTVAPDGGGLT